MRWQTGSQWSFFRAGVVCALRSRPRTRRAAVSCRGVIVDVGRLMRTRCSCRCVVGRVMSQDVTWHSGLELRSWNNRRRWKQQVLTTLFTCCFICSSLSKRTSRSWTDLEDWTVVREMVRLWHSAGILEIEEREPKQMNSDLEGLSSERCEA